MPFWSSVRGLSTAFHFDAGDFTLETLCKPTLADASVCNEIVGSGIFVFTLLPYVVVDGAASAGVAIGSALAGVGSVGLFFNDAFLFCNSSNENMMSASSWVHAGCVISAELGRFSSTSAVIPNDVTGHLTASTLGRCLQAPEPCGV